jgi:preprotein translocase subunit SecB
MAENTPDSPASNGNGANGSSGNGGATDTRTFGIRQLYVKDLSFEAPNSPGILTERGVEPEIKLNLRTTQRDFGNSLYEVVLHVSVHAQAGTRTVFLIELDQAGVFQISGFSADELRAVIGIGCPNNLFPYAREAISSIVQRGGFAPLVLQPIDFTNLFAQAQASRQAGAAPADAN